MDAFLDTYTCYFWWNSISIELKYHLLTSKVHNKTNPGRGTGLGGLSLGQLNFLKGNVFTIVYIFTSFCCKTWRVYPDFVAIFSFPSCASGTGFTPSLVHGSRCQMVGRTLPRWYDSNKIFQNLFFNISPGYDYRANALIKCFIGVTHGYILINHINTSNFGDTFILSTEQSHYW